MAPVFVLAHLLPAVEDLDRALDAYQTAYGTLREAQAHDARDKALAPTSRALARSLRIAFRAQRKSFLIHLASMGASFPTNEAARVAAPTVHRRLREAVTRWDIPFNDAAAATLSLFTDPLQAAMEAAMKAGGTWESLSLDIDDSFTLTNPRAVAWLDGRAAEQVVRINETTRAKLETIITDGLANGESYSKIAASIRSTYDGWETSATPGKTSFQTDRADVIADTELAYAYEGGTRAVIDDLTAMGLDMEQSFLTAAPCDECQENEDAGWIPVDQDFPNGPAPVHPNCRCTVLYQRAQEAA